MTTTDTPEPNDDAEALADAKRAAAGADAQLRADLINVVADADRRRDVIPPRGLTADTVQQFDAAHRDHVVWHLTLATAVPSDVDGLPIGVTPVQATRAPMPHLLLTAEQRATLGVPEPDTGTGDA